MSSEDVEKWGSGLRRIYEECASQGVKVSFEVLKYSFSVIFYRSLKGQFTENVGEKLSKEERRKQIIRLLKQDNTLTILSLSKKLKVNPKTIERDLQELQDKVRYIGPAKGGHWEVLE